MDTSEQYIKMCNCPEIQSRELKFAGIYSFYNYDFLPDMWLPRQDQIQEMLPENNCKCPCCLIFHLNKFVEDNIDGFADGGIDSMEQYWLAFLMWENHQKVWGSKKEKWVKSGKK